MLSLSPRNHVPITYREIESHEYDVAAQIRAQSRKETEKFELVRWLPNAATHLNTRALS